MENSIDINNFSSFKQVKKISFKQNCKLSAILLLKDGRLAVSLYDNSIQIINLNTYECDMTLMGHTSYAYHLSQLDNGSLISYAFDKETRIWTINENEYTVEIIEHEDFGMKLEALSRNRIAMWKDNSINIVDAAPPHIILGVLALDSYINQILQLKDENYVATQDSDDAIKIWDMNTYKIVTTFEVTFDDIETMIETTNHKLLVGGFSKLTIIDLDKKVIEIVLKDEKFKYIDSLLELRDGTILLGCGNGELALLNLSTKEYTINETELTKDTKELLVFNLIGVNDKTFLVGTKDEYLRVWNY